MCYLKPTGKIHDEDSLSFWVAYEHSVGSTGWAHLSGHKHCAVVGWKQDDGERVTINPIAIGYLVRGLNRDGAPYLDSNGYQVAKLHRPVLKCRLHPTRS